MAYPDDLLSPGEHVVIHQHPHWKSLLGPVLVLLAVAIGGTYLVTAVAGQSWASTARIAFAAVAVVLVTWLVLAPLARWRTTHFTITDERVMYRIGVFKRTGLTIPLSRIDSVRFDQSFGDRLFGCGTLVVESASDEPLEFDDIPGVKQVYATLYREINDNPDDDHQSENRVTDGRA